MKKKIITMLLILILCLGMTMPAFATETEGFADEYYRVIDMADLLTDSEEASLIETLDEISIRQSMDIVVATTDDLEGYSVVEYADLLYEQCNFGYGENKDGLLLLISMEDNDWYISTCGYGITAFTDAGIKYIGKQITPDLSDGNFAAAFDIYAKLCDDFITQAKTGEPYNSSNLPRESLSLIWIPISLIIGLVVAFLIVGQMKGRMKSVRTQASASNYMKDGSLNVTNRNEMFLYRTVTRTEKPKDKGSSTHTSSSGTTHGGGGGKF